MSAENEHPGLVNWLLNGERGLSSETIARVCSAKNAPTRRPAKFHYPHDLSDFRRCELLLRAVPTLRQNLPRLAALSPEWTALIDRWDEIVALLEAERGNLRPRHVIASTPRTGALFREAIVEAQR